MKWQHGCEIQDGGGSHLGVFAFPILLFIFFRLAVM
jgi:hypothetical protein